MERFEHAQREEVVRREKGVGRLRSRHKFLSRLVAPTFGVLAVQARSSSTVQASFRQCCLVACHALFGGRDVVRAADHADAPVPGREEMPVIS